MKKKRARNSPLEIDPKEFKKLGYAIVDEIAEFLSSLPEKPVSPDKSPRQVRKALGTQGLPRKGTPPGKLLKETADLLFENSLFNGHPRFWGYISSSAAPIGALGDLLASSVNPNVGSFQLSPVATEIESQTIRWIAELIGYPSSCGGILVSGGNMANFVCFVAARKAMLRWNVREAGVAAPKRTRFRVYTSSETHTWIQKAADLFGLGTDSIRWIPTDKNLRMDPRALREQIRKDVSNGEQPLMVVGTAGSVGTGAIDPLPELAKICKEHKLWFHVDGAYGALAAVLPDHPRDLDGLSQADSVAVDPHKWLYAPMEAGCALVREPQMLLDAFSYHPPYYTFGGDGEELPTNYYERGPQNSRGFRALKVWLGLRQVGRDGYESMIAEDVRLARILYQNVRKYDELEALTNGLSITTFRFVPGDLRGKEDAESYLNQLNTELLARLQASGEAFCSSTLIAGKFVLRVCIVNFRTTVDDVESFPSIVLRIGRQTDRILRSSSKKTVSTKKHQR
ncbi:MAG: aminotransferase class V-fold PLP-dependent enzyme [Bacteroidota bacterium]